MQFGKQNSYAHWWYSWPFLVFLAVCAILLAISVYERFMVERDMYGRKEAAIIQYQQLTEREQELKERVEYLRGERGVEEEIRKNFDVARAGEQVIILTGEPMVSPEPEASTVVGYPWYQFWR